MPNPDNGKEDGADVEAKSNQFAEATPQGTAIEGEVHPNIDADTPHVDPTGVADFDRPYDQWSNHDLTIRAKQLGVEGVIGHGELIENIREAELRLAEQQAAQGETS